MKILQITLEIWVWGNCGWKYGSLGRSHQISPDWIWGLRLRDRTEAQDMEMKIPRGTEERPTGSLRCGNLDRLIGSIFAEKEDIKNISIRSVIGDRDMDIYETEGWQGFWKICKPWSKGVCFLKSFLRAFSFMLNDMSSCLPPVIGSFGIFFQHYGYNEIGLPKGGRYCLNEIDDHRESLVGRGSINTGRNFEFFHTHSFPVFHFSFLLSLWFCIRWEWGTVMSQASLIKAGGSNKGKDTLKPRLKITVPKFDNTELIKGYSNTLIGRCMNPQKQEMNNLLYMLPRIWHVEGKVAAADLGLGRFQIDFDEEADILEVLKMGPFHFDYWMLSVVRWQPVMDPNYPSEIMFWVRVLGVPLQYWAAPTFMSIGDALGEAKAVDLDGGRVQVLMDGFKPLEFETTVGFEDGGEETTILLRYERLHGFCKECRSLCHDYDHCPILRSQREEKERQDRVEKERLRRKEEKNEFGTTSYKGIVINGVKEGDDGRRYNSRAVDYKGNGKGKGVETREDRGYKAAAFRGKQKTEGEGYTQSRGTHGEQGRRYGGALRGISRGGEEESKDTRFRATGVRREGRQEVSGAEGRSPRHGSVKKARTCEGPHAQVSSAGKTLSSNQQSGKKVRKELKFDEEDTEAKETMAEVDTLEAEFEMNLVVGITGGQKTDVQEAVVTEDGSRGVMEEQAGSRTLSCEANGDITEGGMAVISNMDEDLLLEEMEPEEELEDFQESEDADLATVTEFEDLQVDKIGGTETQVELSEQSLAADKKVPHGKKQGARKKLVKSTVGAGVGPMRRMVHAAKTPRKKVTARAVPRCGKRTEDNKDDQDPSEGSGAGNAAA